MSRPIRHITLFIIKDDVSNEVRRQALELLQGLRESDKGMSEWRAAESMDTRRGYVLVVNGKFVDAAAQERFRVSERHQAVGRFMRDISSWVNGHYEEEA